LKDDVLNKVWLSFLKFKKNFFFLIDSTYTLSLFYQELESLGIISKGQCIERIFNQISFYNKKLNCDLTLELIHILYKNLLISEIINNTIFFVRLFLID